MKIFILFLSLITLSCNSQKKISQKENIKNEVKKENPKNNKSTNQKAIIKVLAQDSYGGYEIEKQLIIKDEKGLQEIYGKINSIRRPGLPIPNVDFKNEMVIALFMGQKTSGGYSISVQDIKSTNLKTEVSIKETKPKSITTTIICHPFYFCKVKRTDKDIVFKKVE